MAMPEAMGGIQADPITQLEVVETLWIGDGAVGCVAMIGSDGGFYAAHLPEAVADEMYAAPNVVTASVLVRHGQAGPVPGGYRVSGHSGRKRPFRGGPRGRRRVLRSEHRPFRRRRRSSPDTDVASPVERRRSHHPLRLHHVRMHDGDEGPGQRSRGGAFLTKPFTAETMESALGKLLG